ncbi:MAG: thioredoxin family protein [Campylobacterales bacterium]|nr:thioredoxin family protein [Campylobacterales bacterium]
MKTFLLILSLGFSLFAAEKLGYYTDYDKAVKAALKADKPIMLVQATDSCSWCKRLESRTLSHPEVKAAVSKGTIPLLLERDSSIYPEKFYTTRVPTIFFIRPKGEEEYWEVMGFVDSEEMLDNLETALEMYTEKPDLE